MKIMRKILFGLAVATIALPSVALAQQGTVTGAAGGAAAGAIVGGPVGAVVGGVGGAVVGTMLAPPPAEVRTYVTREEVPSVAYEGDIVVGEPLPRTVEIRRVPQYDSYGYAVVNHERVIVDPRSRKVIEVLR
jgi:hypothetical protein